MITAEWSIVNLDVTLLAQEPKIAPFRQEMCLRLAAVLAIDPRRINIKATTNEGLGEIGRGEAMAAQCVALVQSKDGPLASQA